MEPKSAAEKETPVNKNTSKSTYLCPLCPPLGAMAESRKRCLELRNWA